MKEIKKYQITKDFSISSIYELGASLFKYKNVYENTFNNKDFFAFLTSLDYVRATKIKNLYVGGDGAGITRGLAQAGANGVYIARDILSKEGE